MANTLIGYDNRIDSATVTGGAYQSTLPLTNLQDRRLSKRARTTAVGVTRAGSSATYINSAGRVAYAAANTFRLSYDPANLAALPLPLAEESATNVVRQSENIGFGGLLTFHDATISANATTAPDGTLAADKIVENTVASVEHSVSIPFTSTAQTYTASVFLKAAERSWVILKMWDGTTNHIVWVDLGSATFGPVASESGIVAKGIQPFPNGWYRVWIAGTLVASASTSFTVAVTTGAWVWNHTGDGVSGAYVWGAQIETGSAPSSYIPSAPIFSSRASTATYYNSSGHIASATTNTARNNYNPSDLTAPAKLLLEAAATNLMLQSEDLTSAGWTKSNATISANATTAPDGTLAADKIVENTVASVEHSVSQGLTSTAQTYTASVFLKAGERTWAFIKLWDGTTNHMAYVNLATGIFGSASNVAAKGIVALPNGWYRVWISANMAASAGSAFAVAATTANDVFTHTGDGTSGLHFWGAQVEAGRYPTSYIPTTTAAVTRAADVIATPTSTVRAADAFDARVDIALPAASLVGVVGLAGFNLSTSALFRVRGHSSATMTSTPGYDSGWLFAWPVPGDYGEMPGLCLAQPNAALRYWRIEIYDPTNPDGFVEYGRVFVGKAWQPATNADYGWSLAYEDETVVEAAISGAEYFDQRPTFRVMRFGYSWLGEADAATAQDVIRLSGVSGDVVVAWDVATLTTGWQRSFLGRLRTLGALENPDPVRYSMAFEVRETVA